MHYDDELQKASGQNFNLFDILSIGHYEVKTHSPFIGELLNPCGRHCMGDIFLRHFLEILKSDFGLSQHLKKFETGSAKVLLEKCCGETGRLDIAIADCSNRQLIIENKIYAGDQESQLERYLGINPKPSVLVYLTLYGDRSPSFDAAKDKDTDGRLVAVSYKKDILKWLELCVKEAAAVPVVREAIMQYMNLIKKLTNQNIGSVMSREIINNILADSSSYSVYIRLSGMADLIRNKMLAKVLKKIVTADYGEYRLYGELTTNYNDKEWECIFANEKLSKIGLAFGIEFAEKYMHSCECVFKNINSVPMDSNLSKLLAEELKKDFGIKFKSNDWWVYASFPNQELQNWNDSVLGELYFNNSKIEIVIDNIKKLAQIADRVLEKYSDLK